MLLRRLCLKIVFIHPLLLDLQQPVLHLFLQGAVVAVDDGSGKDDVAFLLEDLVDLPVLAADMEKQTVLLFESQVTRS